jgi:hypothetical protein
MMVVIGRRLELQRTPGAGKPDLLHDRFLHEQQQHYMQPSYHPCQSSCVTVKIDSQHDARGKDCWVEGLYTSGVEALQEYRMKQQRGNM